MPKKKKAGSKRCCRYTCFACYGKKCHILSDTNFVDKFGNKRECPFYKRKGMVD